MIENILFIKTRIMSSPLAFNCILGLVFYGVLNEKDITFNYLKTLSYNSVLIIVLIIPIQIILLLIRFLWSLVCILIV